MDCLLVCGSVVAKVLKSVEALCDHYNIDKHYRSPILRIYKDGRVTASVGEINWGGSYVFLFDRRGKLMNAHMQTWSYYGDITKTPVALPEK